MEKIKRLVGALPDINFQQNGCGGRDRGESFQRIFGISGRWPASMSRQQGNVIFTQAGKKGRAARIIGRRTKGHARV